VPAGDFWHDASMAPLRVLGTLETDRLILRRRTVGEAAIYRRLWTERDLRVPTHRRINAEGRPTVDFADEVRRFETDLIRWALLHTGGHQRRAARMLNLKVTTLNAKIKRYGIRPHALHSGKVVDLYPEGQTVG